MKPSTCIVLLLAFAAPSIGDILGISSQGNYVGFSFQDTGYVATREKKVLYKIPAGTVGFTPDEVHFYYCTGKEATVHKTATGEVVDTIRVLRTLGLQFNNDLGMYTYRTSSKRIFCKSGQTRELLSVKGDYLTYSSRSNVDWDWSRNLVVAEDEKGIVIYSLTDPADPVHVRFKEPHGISIDKTTSNIIVGKKPNITVILNTKGEVVQELKDGHKSAFLAATPTWALYKDGDLTALDGTKHAIGDKNDENTFFSPDNKYVLLSYSNAVECYELEKAEVSWSISRTEIVKDKSNYAFFKDFLAEQESKRLAARPQKVKDYERIKDLLSKGNQPAPASAGTVIEPRHIIQKGLAGTADIKYSPNGKYVAAASEKDIILFDAKTRYQIKWFQEHKGLVSVLAFSQSSKILASGTRTFLNTSDIIARDIETGKVIFTKSGFSEDIVAVALNATGTKIAANGKSGTVNVWSTKTGNLIRKIKAHNGTVEFIGFSKDGDNIYTSIENYRTGEQEGDRTVKSFSLSSGNCVRKIYPGYTKIEHVDFNCERNVAAILSRDGKFSIRNMTTGNIVFQDYVSNNAYKIAVGNEGRFVAISLKGRIVISSVLNRHVVMSLETKGKVVTALALSPDESFLLAAHGNDVTMFDLRVLETIPFAPRRMCAASFMKSQDNQHVYIGNADGVRLWSIAKAEILDLFTALNGEITAFDVHGNRMAFGGKSGKIVVIDTRTKKQTKSFNSGEFETTCVKFAPDGTTLFTSNNDGSVMKCDVGSGSSSLFAKHDEQVTSIDITRDGARLVSVGMHNAGHNGILKVWDLKTGKNLGTGTTSGGWIERVAFSPDGREIASGGWDNIVSIWDANTVKRKHHLGKFEEDIYAITYSDDGAYIAFSSEDQTTIVQSTQSGATVLKVENADAWSLAFSPDNKYLLVGGMVCHVYDIKNKKLVASMLTADEMDFLVYTPDYYYKSSKNSLGVLTIGLGNKVYPFEQFDLRLNRPDIVLQRLGYAEQNLIDLMHTAYTKRLRRNGLSEQDISKELHLPVAGIFDDGLSFVTTNKDFTLPLFAYDTKYPLRSLHVWVNKVPLYGSKGLALDAQPAQTFDDSVKLELVPGTNTVSVSTVNTQGVTSLKESFLVKYASEGEKPVLHILTIGVSDYINDEYDLRFAAKDAMDLCRYFETNKDGFKSVNSFMLNDQNATREKILEQAATLRQTKPNDHVIVFVAAHGVLDDNLDYYIATHDFDFDLPSKRGLKYSELEGLLDGIPALKKILLIDACHSGEIDDDAVVVASADQTSGPANVKSRGFKVVKRKAGAMNTGNAFDLMRTLFNDLRSGTGTIVISSASGKEYAFESDEYQNGVFTFALIRSLEDKSADKNGDSYIQVSELQDVVYSRVAELTRGKQNPTTRRQNTALDFDILGKSEKKNPAVWVRELDLPKKAPSAPSKYDDFQPKGSIEGTCWKGIVNRSYPKKGLLCFNAGGKVAFKGKSNYNGTWKQKGDVVFFELDNYEKQYEISVSGSKISGRVWSDWNNGEISLRRKN